jgi:hypothetical protein
MNRSTPGVSAASWRSIGSNALRRRLIAGGMSGCGRTQPAGDQTAGVDVVAPRSSIASQIPSRRSVGPVPPRM